MEGTRYRRLRRTCVAIRAESDTADRRPSFRGMSATDSENAQNSGRIPVGISGRVPSEWVADLRRNQWPGWVGIRIKDLETWKGKYDAAFLTGDYDEFLFYGMRFSTALPIVACGAFHPEFDFKGKNLQIITRGESEFEHLCFNLTVVGGKSMAVLGWTGGRQGPAEQFIDSFKALPKDTMANAAFHIACEHLENTYFRPSWWEAQTISAKEYLMRRFRSGTGPSEDTERRSDCLSRLEYSFATATVELELNP